jgi:23S rRNA pseudouridine2605 synthase
VRGKPKTSNATVPLVRAISKLGWGSRKEAQTWILAGRVRINQKIVTDPECRINPDRTPIFLDDRQLIKQTRVVLVFNKPKNTVTTNADEKGRKTVFDLLPSIPGLHSVGRLDMATTGLLIFTNDTRLSSWLTDPKNKVNRTYIATLRGEITTEKCQKLVNGLQMEQEILQAQSCEILKASGRESRVKIVLTEGKNREIRRMMEALNHEVTALKRISYGSLELGPLPVGKYRLFSEPELTALFPAYFTNRRHSFQ